jgi:DNA (cytosine-5)-methyltransferase 1
MGDSDLPRCDEQCGAIPVREESIAVELRGDPWNRYDLLRCSDGKARRVECGAFPMADGLPGRVGEVLGYSNAIVPQVAAQFIAAWDSL